jgi:hypothetical protein
LPNGPTDFRSTTVKPYLQAETRLELESDIEEEQPKEQPVEQPIEQPVEQPVKNTPLLVKRGRG